MTTHGDDSGPADPSSVAAEPPLHTALGELRAAITAAGFPLALASAETARARAAAVTDQLDDYVLPRLARLDAPLLVVVGGSTGAGKSTLVNSLVQARVSASGVLRPTTRSPVLVCNPADTTWFRSGELLPGLTRTNEPGDATDTLLLRLDADPARRRDGIPPRRAGTKPR